jgi:hypothetical protein
MTSRHGGERSPAAEATGPGGVVGAAWLRFWFAPDDGRSVVRVFEVRTDREDPAVRGATGR